MALSIASCFPVMIRRPVMGGSPLPHSGHRMAADFIKDSLALHHAATFGCDGQAAMKENIVIPIKIERLKLWTRWTLEVTSWLICLGLLAAGIVVAACAALAWLVSGSESILTLGLGSGLLLGLAGAWHLLRQLDRAANQLRRETPAGG